MTSCTSTHPYGSLQVATEIPFRLAPSPGRGWGAFATRNITSGSVIIRETALFSFYKPHPLINDSDIWAALCALPPSSQQQFLLLRDNGGAKFRSLTVAFSENCFTVPSASDRGAADGVGCYILLSRMNHSCVPNAKVPDTANEGTSIASFASRDIAEGEEITFCYNTDFECRTSRDRHRELGFACRCRACRPDTDFHRLSEMRRTMIRGLQYLLHGQDIDGKRGSGRSHILFEADLRDLAESYRIGVADKLVYTILTMVLLEQEGLLDQFMLQRIQPGIWKLIMALETEGNLAVMQEVMARVTWQERLGVALELWGKEDAGDEALRSQFEMLDKLRK